MRIATYNVEWFSSLFGPADGLLLDEHWSARYNMTRRAQAEALAKVFRAIDADAVLIMEAPDPSHKANALRAMRHFAKYAEPRCSEPVMGFTNDTQQELVLLSDPRTLSTRHDPQSTAEAPRCDATFHIDLDVDATQDVVRFSKPPLEMSLETASGIQLRLIGAHLKSKAPHGAKTRDQAMRISIANLYHKRASSLVGTPEVLHPCRQQVRLTLEIMEACFPDSDVQSRVQR